MNQDIALKKDEFKMVLLVCGDPQTGKKTIVNNWIKDKENNIDNKSFYKVYTFSHEEMIESTPINIPCEIRILNSDEFETELKINSQFFKGALGAFVCTSIDDEISFQDGEKWKEKLDLMCCLPNKFPLPIFLLINKCDKVNLEKPEKAFQEKEKLDQYILENQFFNANYLSNEKIENNEMISDSMKPFTEMVKVILSFKDLKDKFVNIATNGKGFKGSKENEDGTVLIMNKDKEKKCIIY